MGERYTPEWWRHNRRLRSQLGLPPYEPPTFADGQYFHDVIEPLEREYDVTISVVGHDESIRELRYLTVDGDVVLEMTFTRDSAGNLEYAVECSVIERSVSSWIEE